METTPLTQRIAALRYAREANRSSSGVAQLEPEQIAGLSELAPQMWTSFDQFTDWGNAI